MPDPQMQQKQPPKKTARPGYLRAGDRALEWVEAILYLGIAIFLLITAISLLVVAGRETGSLFSSAAATGDAAVKVLDILLLVFIVVELLFAVRTTVVKRELVAEPFLLVGIIASIKEIVVLSVKAADQVGKGPEFSDSVREIAILGALVLVLGVTAYLLRRKEREPVEGDDLDKQPE
ncbi:uncharacterized membrane protein (DUF373 family) [Nakamurella sp. UYEF19]|uniref:phosphate-starvation-inducible PsiE family protein n=1 Tax=Nakamurella sp. UYEF19 TaxID=1756392 RepID=UPI003396BE51